MFKEHGMESDLAVTMAINMMIEYDRIMGSKPWHPGEPQNSWYMEVHPQTILYYDVLYAGF